MGSNVGREYTYEFIGNELEVISSCCDEYEGLEGKVVDETKNTFVITDGEEKTIPKKCCSFKVNFNGNNEILDGSKLTYRPEDRIKKLG